jgi:hypothetical protein
VNERRLRTTELLGAAGRFIDRIYIYIYGTSFFYRMRSREDSDTGNNDEEYRGNLAATAGAICCRVFVVVARDACFTDMPHPSFIAPRSVVTLLSKTTQRSLVNLFNSSLNYTKCVALSNGWGYKKFIYVRRTFFKPILPQLLIYLLSPGILLLLLVIFPENATPYSSRFEIVLKRSKFWILKK